ncbi:hypothetical protein O6072_18445 [Mycolicibacterium neoaurum]|uniref:hypothetical protein n=1 Tax=Mycolicibacterium neoaurum TaxID=1795 RepID=UPI00248D26F8|nr:hypothetical protein [Mycolicibacterium neoaurum]WBP93198.1 hypothetical protein O7W24_18800 [Mycolicibacterium neoaurum]WBS06835.1 hypothetical protein O6072_18445 [Mycolicibacterium neoaurum]
MTIFDPYEVNVPFKGAKEDSRVQVVNLRQSIPEPDLGDRRKLVTYGEKQWHRLSKNDCWSIAHAVADPAAAISAAQAGGLTEQFAGESALTFLRADVNLPSLFPLIQPRTADVPSVLPPPKTYGVVDRNGSAGAAMIIEFQSIAHLREYTKNAIAGTLKAGRDLRGSILSHGVSQPVLCYTATIVVADTSEEIDVLVVVDGLTRVVMSWWAMLGGEVTSAQLPGAVVDLLLHKKGTGGADGVSGAYRKGRSETFSSLRGRYQAAAGDTNDPDLTRYGQTLRLPASIIVNFRRVGTPLTGDARPFEFPDAVNSAVDQQHSLSKAWAPSAVGANAGTHAVQRAAAEGCLSSTVAEVATGIENFSFDYVELMDSNDGSSDCEIDPGLARALWLVAELTQPDAYNVIKRNLRNLLGEPQIHKRAYADRIFNLISRGWSAWKPASYGNAQRAWAAGGPIPHSLMGTPWTPLFPRRFADLVGIALDKSDPLHDAAVATLQVAGGTALVADGQILAASGSTAEGGYKRSQPPLVIEALATTPRGLWLLAHAADSFHSRRQAVNSFTKISEIPDDAYRIRFPKPSDPVVGVEVTADGGRLNFDRVRDIAGLRQPDDDSSDEEPAEDDHDRMVALRLRMTTAADKLAKTQTEIANLMRDRPDLSVFATHAEWESARDPLQAVFTAVVGWKPAEESIIEDDDFDFDDDYADEVEA